MATVTIQRREEEHEPQLDGSYEIHIDESNEHDAQATCSASNEKIIMVSTLSDDYTEVHRSSRVARPYTSPTEKQSRWFGSDIVDEFQDINETYSLHSNPTERREKRRATSQLSNATTSTACQRTTDRYGFFVSAETDANYDLKSFNQPKGKSSDKIDVAKTRKREVIHCNVKLIILCVTFSGQMAQYGT